MAMTGIEREISCHGVVEIFGISKFTELPSDFSMYFSSLVEIAGWKRGFSNESQSQKQYQTIPMKP